MREQREKHSSSIDQAREVLWIINLEVTIVLTMLVSGQSSSTISLYIF